MRVFAFWSPRKGRGCFCKKWKRNVMDDANSMADRQIVIWKWDDDVNDWFTIEKIDDMTYAIGSVK